MRTMSFTSGAAALLVQLVALILLACSADAISSTLRNVEQAPASHVRKAPTSVPSSRTMPDLVPYLPRIGNLTFKTFSGFIRTNKRFGAHLYYLFLESQGDPMADPVILYLNVCLWSHRFSCWL